MEAAGRIPKRGRNTFHNYDYATEADIAETVRHELAQRGVMLIPEIDTEERIPVGEKGSVLTVLHMNMQFIDAESGETIVKKWRGYGTDKEDKGGYKAMTGGEKYFILKTFLLPTGDDPEADAKPQGYSVQASTAVPASVVGGHAVGEPSRHTAGESGALTILQVDPAWPGSKERSKGVITLSDGRKLPTYDERLVKLAEHLCQEAAPIQITVKVSASQKEYLTGLLRAEATPVTKTAADVKAAQALTDENIPF